MALIDVVFAAGVMSVAAAMAVPALGLALDREQAEVGARYVATAIDRARIEALRRSAEVALEAVDVGGRARLRLFVDGNGTGILQRDVDRGLDWPLTSSEWLDEHASGMAFRIVERVPDPAGSGWLMPGDDPVRIGASSFVSCSPLGSSSGGTLYVAGRRGPQMAVRIFGATGRVRVLRYDARAGQWEF